MGSVFVTERDKVIKDVLGRKQPIPIYLQFVPGLCVEAVHSAESLSYKGEKTINTIIAIPHVTKKLYNKKAIARQNEQNRYFPLLRTVHDLPSQGDPVLLCTIGRINYYLGPLNSMENNVTFNDDPNFTQELNLNLDFEYGGVSELGKQGQSPNFNKEVLYNRLQKKRKEGLDYGTNIGETTGDTLFEGRHGNSIRIGSRSNNPYIFISNQRVSTNNFESIGDGSLISITSNGNINQHLGGEGLDDFQLASDTIPADKINRRMGEIISIVNDGIDTNTLLYTYGSELTDKTTFEGKPIYQGLFKNQMLLHSDRIIINSKGLDGDIYLSSKRDVHIGTGRHLTISTNEDFIIESQRTYLGGTPTEQMESMILGDSLILILEELLTLLGATTSNMYFPVPLAIAGTPLKQYMDDLKNRLDIIKSNKHFIEPN